MTLKEMIRESRGRSLEKKKKKMSSSTSRGNGKLQKIRKRERDVRSGNRKKAGQSKSARSREGAGEVPRDDIGASRLQTTPVERSSTQSIPHRKRGA